MPDFNFEKCVSNLFLFSIFPCNFDHFYLPVASAGCLGSG